jgi:hypothetical protein
MQHGAGHAGHAQRILRCMHACVQAACGPGAHQRQRLRVGVVPLVRAGGAVRGGARRGRVEAELRHEAHDREGVAAGGGKWREGRRMASTSGCACCLGCCPGACCTPTRSHAPPMRPHAPPCRHAPDAGDVAARRRGRRGHELAPVPGARRLGLQRLRVLLRQVPELDQVAPLVLELDAGAGAASVGRGGAGVGLIRRRVWW